jgi:hypothetical protein
MKKLYFIAIFCLISVFFSFCAFAIEKIPDEDLDTVTGKAGINLQLYGNLKIEIKSTNIGWGDLDGLGGDLTNMCFFKLESSQYQGTFGKTIIELTSVDPLFVIDVATTGNSAIEVNGKTAVSPNTTFIKIDLPDDLGAEITPCEFTDFLLTGDPTVRGGDNFATIQTENLKVYIKEFPTNMYISAH